MEPSYSPGKPGLADRDSVVVLRDVTKEYTIAGRNDAVAALKGITLSDDASLKPIKRGEFVMIRGPSGGGKTTLLNLLGTIDTASSGTVELLGHSLGANSPDHMLARLRLEMVGFVFQTFNLLATMSAYENVQLPMNILNKLSSAEKHHRTIELLTRVGLVDRMEHLPAELSGGEQQRVTIARALANAPEILLLDEPTGDLDTRNTVEIMNLLLEINIEEQSTMVMVTHNPDVECYADRILYVEDGRFAEQAINEEQTPLSYEEYIAYLDTKQDA